VGYSGKDFIDELCYDIESRDLIKGKLVLASIGNVDEQTRKQTILKLIRGQDDFVISLLVTVMVENPQLKEVFSPFRETLFSKILANPDFFVEILEREKGSTRNFLVEVAGEIRFKPAVPILISMLNGEENSKAIETIIVSLGMIADPSACNPVSEYLYTENMNLIRVAAKTLGQLGTPTAVQRMAERLGIDSDLDLLILDLFASIQSPESFEKLNETLVSHFVRLRTVGKKKLVEIGTKAVPMLLENLLHDDPDLLIHSLNVLGEIGDGSAVYAIRRLLHNEPRDPNVRFAAYDAMGMLPVQKGAFTLAAGLQDSVENVRVAAAKAIDRNYDTVLAAGLKNIIRHGDNEAMAIIRTVINALCDNIVIDLMGEEFFEIHSVKYMHDEAHPDTRGYFVKLLMENGLQEIATKIAGPVEERAAHKPLVYAVDDSKMILNIYRSTLHNIGYRPMLFEFPATALERVRVERPQAILTDLNMPDIDGVEFTRRVRQWFDKDELPIIMVTTQNDVQDADIARKAGVNTILHKPFTETQIKAVLSEYLE
jgi:CheY-like chemotaxis protein/HEAT repeat protein